MTSHAREQEFDHMDNPIAEKALAGAQQPTMPVVVAHVARLKGIRGTGYKNDPRVHSSMRTEGHSRDIMSKVKSKTV